MLALFRSFAKSWVAALLMGLLIVSFAIFGINDVFKPRAQNWVVRAGDRDISATMFKTMFDGAKSQQEQQIGRPITVEEVQQAHFDVLFLKELAGQETLNALLSKWGLRPSDHLVVAELRKQPNFFDQISGAFDQATYERVLAEKLSLKPAQYEGYLRDTMAGEHFSTGIYNGFTVPRIVTAINAAYGMESREATFVAMDPRRVPPPAQPTEAEIKTFYDQNAERLKLPEFRTISIVRFSAQDYLGTVTVDPAKVQKAFDFKKDSLSTPETRSLVQIPIKDQAAGAAIIARLNKGEDPVSVARSLKIEPVIYDNKPKSAVVDRKVADAAFALPSGTVSEPIKGDLSWSVIKVTGVRAARPADFAALRPQIEGEVRKQLATEKVYNLSNIYDEAHNGGSNLAEAAAKAGAAVVTLGPVTADGRDMRGQPLQGISPDVLKRAYALGSGEDTGIEEAGPGEYYAVRVDKVMPSAPPPLADIKGQIVQAMMQQRMTERLRASAEAAAARVRKGESLEAVASSVGGQLGHVSGIDRATASERVKTFGEPLLMAALGAKTGEVFFAPLPNGVYALGRVDKISTGDLTQMAKLAQAQRAGASMQYFQDLVVALRSGAQDVIKTRTNISNARLAIGFDPEEVKKLEAAESGKPAKK